MVGLFDLVEEDDAIWFPPHRLCQLATLFVAYVAGWRTDQSRDGVSFHVLAHVYAHHVLLAVEESLRQGFGQFGLAYAGGAQEDEGARWAFADP